MRLGALLLLLLSVEHQPAHIVHRHDVPDSAFVEFARRYPAPVHLHLPTPQGAGDGEGTLIAPRWVLTAAHVAADMGTGHRVTIRDIARTVDSIVIHPQWSGGPHDLALLRLSRPVDSVSPIPLYRGTDELNQVLVIVGYGDFGTGETGPAGNDRQVRGATNRVDNVTDSWIAFRFDAPGDPRVTPLEGVSGPGDSGGPAFIGRPGGVMLAGVSSAQSTRGSGGLAGRYGAVEYYVRVSRYAGWIDAVAR